MSLLEELKQRKVLRVAIIYVAGAWVLIQVVETVFPIFELSASSIRLTTIALFLGFPVTLVVSWFYDLTPWGLRLEREIRSFGFEDSKDESLNAATLKNSIVVLPFSDVSPNRDQEHFSEGISEQLRSGLAQIEKLRVISRYSASTFTGQSLTVSDIASALRVAYVLDGTVNRSENRVRVTAQLVNAISDTLEWTETYDRSLGEIFSVQDEITESVLAEMQIRLAGDAPGARPTNADAYSLYLQAQHVAHLGTADAYKDAIQLLNEALAIDDSYAPAWSALSEIIIHEVNHGSRPGPEGIESARDAAQSALKVDPTLASAHLQLSWIAAHYDWDFERAVAHLKAAGPGKIFFHRAADLASVLGNAELAEHWGRQAVLEDPVSPWPYTNLSNYLIITGDLSSADLALSKAIKLSPTNEKARWLQSMLRLIEGQAEVAMDLASAIANDEMRSFAQSMGYFAVGDLHSSDEQLQLHINEYGDHSAYNIAEIYAFRDEPELAFQWLEKAFDNHDTTLAGIKRNPHLRKLRHHPKMQPFLSKIGLSDEQVARIKLDSIFSELASKDPRANVS